MYSTRYLSSLTPLLKCILSLMLGSVRAMNSRHVIVVDTCALKLFLIYPNYVYKEALLAATTAERDCQMWSPDNVCALAIDMLLLSVNHRRMLCSLQKRQSLSKCGRFCRN